MAGLIGGAGGLVGAAALGWLVFQGGRRLSVQRFFAITSLFIMLLAAGLFSAGIGRLQGIGLLPGGDPLWDTSWLLDDHGSVGGFLAGLVGYRARPSALEVAGYILYLAGATALVMPSLFGRSAPRNGNNVVEPAPPSRV